MNRKGSCSCGKLNGGKKTDSVCFGGGEIPPSSLRQNILCYEARSVQKRQTSVVVFVIFYYFLELKNLNEGIVNGSALKFPYTCNKQM